MKKLKLLVPTITASVLAMTPLFSMTSCSSKDVDKTLAGYTVDKNTHRIYGLNKQNERFELTDKQINDMEGGYLLTLGDESFVYVDKDGKGSDEKTYPTTIAGWMNRAKDQHAFYYEIWLLGGTYNLVEKTESVTDVHIKFDIKGIVDNHGKLTSTVDIVPGHPKEDDKTKITKSIDVGNFRELNFSTVNIQGAMHERQGSDWDVSGANDMSFEYCHFYGLSIFETEYLDLYGCTLDSDCIEWGTPTELSRTFSTTQYSLWIKDVDFASLSYCNFISDGKALKLQPKGKSDNPTYVFNTCDFQIGEKGIPQEPKVEGQPTESDQDKYAVDANNASLTGSQKLYVYWYGITGAILEEGQQRDWKHHSGSIGEMEASQWNPDHYELHKGELPA